MQILKQSIKKLMIALQTKEEYMGSLFNDPKIAKDSITNYTRRHWKTESSHCSNGTMDEEQRAKTGQGRIQERKSVLLTNGNSMGKSHES